MNRPSMPTPAACIAVASQNRRTVTGHAGRCRRFRLYDSISRAPIGEIELTPEQVLHAGGFGPEHPLGRAQVLIAAGFGPGLARRLQRGGVICYASAADDPSRAVADYLDGVPPAVFPTAGGDCDTHGAEAHGCHGHDPQHGHPHPLSKEQ